jgi:hypothetical protein
MDPTRPKKNSCYLEKILVTSHLQISQVSAKTVAETYVELSFHLLYGEMIAGPSSLITIPLARSSSWQNA